jgi:hypothetical protein
MWQPRSRTLWRVYPGGFASSAVPAYSSVAARDELHNEAIVLRDVLMEFGCYPGNLRELSKG